MKHGGAEEYDALLKIYKEAEMHEEKLRALRALGVTRDPSLLQRTLVEFTFACFYLSSMVAHHFICHQFFKKEFGLSEDVRSQDVFYVIASTASYPAGRQATWEFVKANWATFDSTFLTCHFFTKRALTQYLLHSSAEKFGEGGFLLPRIISLTCSDFTRYFVSFWLP